MKVEMAETQGDTKPEIVMSDMTIHRCECPAWKGVHLHRLRIGCRGRVGEEGPDGNSPPKEWKLERDPAVQASQVLMEKCRCILNGVNQGVHVHIESVGPRGPRGAPGPPGITEPGQAVMYDIKFEQRKFTVIEDCTWCGIHLPHNHAVLEGHLGAQGPIGRLQSVNDFQE